MTFVTDEPLACPQCGRTYRVEERFCSACRMPLVVSEHDEEHLTDAQQRARKVKPQYARGEVSKVAMGRNQVEAELIQGILIEEGIPSILQRTPGFDVPDFLAAGPRDVMVPQSGVEAARSLLEELEVSDGAEPPPTGSTVPTAHRLMAAILAVLVAALGLSLLLLQLSS